MTHREGFMPVSDRQPALHDLVTCLRAPTTVLSGADGQLRGRGAEGVFVADVRALSTAVLSVGVSNAGEPVDVLDEPEAVVMAPLGADAAEFVSVLRPPLHPVPDPAVWLRRRRLAEPLGCAETITVTSVLDAEVEFVARIRLATDLAGIWAVRAGHPVPHRPWRVAAGGAAVVDAPVTVGVTPVEPAGADAAVRPEVGLLEDGAGIQLTWATRVPPRSAVSFGWWVRSVDRGAVVAPAGAVAALVAPRVSADDRRLAPLVATAVADLDALRMTAVGSPDEVFIAAGSPWYLTLFGRDALWAARMLLPLGTEIAAGTLRALSARQGAESDPATGEEPGKILHEVRRGDDRHAGLPPVYYGTVDATPLWVCLLAEAWRFGLDAAVVEALLPAAERALGWMAADGDADGDGFLEYVDRSGRGLANQGWKDSSDSIRFADGRVAVGPIALAEVQGYAHEAAIAGADLLDAFGRPGGSRWRAYASELAARFRERFWVSDGLGPYPAIALDADKRPVDAPASNMGHLLGTGMLTDAESAAIAARLTHPSMSSGFGLRTMASSAGGYSPLSYHCGSVWPHDTAIAIHGLLRAGRRAEAVVLAEGLLAAGNAFRGRLPELYGGFAADEIPVPVPYPASCRPQGWSAGAAVMMLRAFLGLEPDAPRGMVAVRPGAGLGALDVGGLQVAGAGLRVAVDGAGEVRAEIDGGGLRILTGP
jgi:glycogen debranching enzyme